MSQSEQHRPGIIVFERSGVVVADLDSGEWRELGSEESSDGVMLPSAIRELTVVPGPAPAPVPAVPMSGGVLDVDLEAVVVNGPLAARVDGGRVLLWDDRCASHVACDPGHVRVLSAAVNGLLLADLGPEDLRAAGDLFALGALERCEADDVRARRTLSKLSAPVERATEEHRGAESGTPVGGGRRVEPGRRRRRRPWRRGPASDRRVPVIPLNRWSGMATDDDCGEMVEPSLSIGMLFAAARAHDDGRLTERYDIRRLQPDAEAVLTEWERDPRPAIFVFSDYLWNVDRHLELSARIKRLSPESLCLHGGPSVPKREGDLQRFLTEHPAVDVAARGEGEQTFPELLDALDGDLSPGSLERLRDVAGLTYRSRRNGEEVFVRTADRERMSDLDAVPSPFLTGEFDDLLSVPWRSASIETNRGCPYGCTFCDWGSATLSRIRKFDLERVRAELDWIAERAGPSEVFITDANFGIYSRDVDITRHIAELRQRVGAPYAVVFNLAKNTAKYSKQIIEIMVAGDVHPIVASSAVQTHDPVTLRAVRRENISLEKYDEIAETFTEVGLPLATDLLVGLPGATVESFKDDLQQCFDREVTPRAMEVILLPNSPMNDPDYRAEHEIEVDHRNVVVGTSSYTRADYDRMLRLRLLFRAADHFGVLRHVLRYLQWDHGLRAIDVLDDLDRAVAERGNRFPLLAFVARMFDVYTVPPVAWEPFFDEVVDFVQETYGIEVDSAFASVLLAQQAVLPSRTRRYPLSVDLGHDVVAYRNDRAGASGLAVRRPLSRYGPATLRVDDPHQIGREFVRRNEFPGQRTDSQNLFYMGYDWELDSPLVRYLATSIGRYESAAL